MTKQAQNWRHSAQNGVVAHYSHHAIAIIIAQIVKQVGQQATSAWTDACVCMTTPGDTIMSIYGCNGWLWPNKRVGILVHNCCSCYCCCCTHPIATRDIPARQTPESSMWPAARTLPTRCSRTHNNSTVQPQQQQLQRSNPNTTTTTTPWVQQPPRWKKMRLQKIFICRGVIEMSIARYILYLLHSEFHGAAHRCCCSAADDHPTNCSTSSLR
jgi:hypothetical protein